MTKKYKWKDEIKWKIFILLVGQTIQKGELVKHRMSKEQFKDFLEYKEFFEPMKEKNIFEIDDETSDQGINTFYKHFKNDIEEVKLKN